MGNSGGNKAGISALMSFIANTYEDFAVLRSGTNQHQAICRIQPRLTESARQVRPHAVRIMPARGHQHRLALDREPIELAVWPDGLGPRYRNLLLADIGDEQLTGGGAEAGRCEVRAQRPTGPAIERLRGDLAIGRDAHDGALACSRCRRHRCVLPPAWTGHRR